MVVISFHNVLTDTNRSASLRHIILTQNQIVNQIYIFFGVALCCLLLSVNLLTVVVSQHFQQPVDGAFCPSFV